MKTEEMICELRRLEEAHKDDFVGTGETNWSLMCHDVANRLEELLAAQEPRVMTLEEAQNSLHNDTVVWVELKGKILCGGIRMDGTDYFTMQNNDVLDVTDFDSGEGAEMYGKEVRCWTSRPDQATREAVKWDG